MGDGGHGREEGDGGGGDVTSWRGRVKRGGWGGDRGDRTRKRRKAGK